MVSMSSIIILKSCDCEQGYQYGIKLHDYLKKKTDKDFCISIYLYGKKVYHYSSDGCSPDKDRWLIRKRNTCLYFGKSTYDLYKEKQNIYEGLVEKYGLDYKEYTFTPGSVPIKIINGGIIGAVTISGFKAEEDHEYIIDFFKSLDIKVSE